VVLEGVVASGIAVAIGAAVSIGVAVVVVVVVVLSVVPGEGDAAGVVVVSVFCSQAAKSAALARMQMYFFIIFWIEGPYWAKG
jgi:hypothetical protein